MSAYFSPCRRWRYSLTRNLDTLDGEGRVTFIGLNPSKPIQEAPPLEPTEASATVVTR